MSKLGLKWGILIPIGLALLLGIAAIVTFIAMNNSRTTIDITNDKLNAMASQYANASKASLDRSFTTVKTLGSLLEKMAGTDQADRDFVNNVMENVIAAEPSIYTLWLVFEPNAFDGNDAQYVNRAPDHDATGRFVPFFYRDGGKIVTEALTGYDVPGDGDYYLLAKNSGRENITAPYSYAVGNSSILVSSAAYPFKKNGNVIGVVGTDIDLSELNAMVGSIRVYDSGYAVLVDQQANIVSHPDSKTWMKPLRNFVAPEAVAVVQASLQDGQIHRTTAVSAADGKESIVVTCPIPIAETGSNWVMMVIAPSAEVMAPVRAGLWAIVGAGLALIIASLLILYITVHRITGVVSAIGRDTNSVAGELSLASDSIDNSSSQMANATSTLASSLEEISSSINELNSITQQTSENAKISHKTANENAQAIREGSSAVKDMLAAMGEINESADKVGLIIKTIEGIAFQTNLLALNAAVEAARAGEAGKGFAVVADEVRTLAQRSAQSANETTQLINLVVERIKHGTSIADVLSNRFTEIESGSQTVSKLVEEISEAVGEQASGVEQINSSVAQLDKVSQEVANNAENASETSHTLQAQIGNLDNVVNRMMTIVAGAKSGNNRRNAAQGGRRNMRVTKLLPMDTD